MFRNARNMIVSKTSDEWNYCSLVVRSRAYRDYMLHTMKQSVTGNIVRVPAYLHKMATDSNPSRRLRTHAKHTQKQTRIFSSRIYDIICLCVCVRGANEDGKNNECALAATRSLSCSVERVNDSTIQTYSVDMTNRRTHMHSLIIWLACLHGRWWARRVTHYDKMKSRQLHKSWFAYIFILVNWVRIYIPNALKSEHNNYSKPHDDVAK